MTSDAPGVPTVVAQTNVQLYNQLQAAGWSELDRARVKGAYALSLRILASRFRPDGKPFTAHGIGTASILAGAGAKSTLCSRGSCTPSTCSATGARDRS